MEIGRRFAAAAPETIVVVTPHNVHVSGHFAVVDAGAVAGSLAEWDQPERTLERGVDRGLVAALVVTADVPVVSVSYGGNDRRPQWPRWTGDADPALVPARAARGRRQPSPRPQSRRARRARPRDRRAAAEARVALVASADHGHAHDADGPYGYDPAAAAYDDLVVELVRENRLGELDGLAELVEAAKADSLWQLAVLHGALGSDFDVELLSYEAPTYFGMLCAAYAPAA